VRLFYFIYYHSIFHFQLARSVGVEIQALTNGHFFELAAFCSPGLDWIVHKIQPSKPTTIVVEQKSR